MKILIVTCLTLFFVNSVYSQNVQLFNGRIFMLNSLNNDSLDYFIINNNSTLFRAPKGKIKLSIFPDAFGNMFKEVVHSQRGEILSLIETLTENKSGQKTNDFKCKPIVENNSSKKYSFKEIIKCIKIIEGLRLDWKNRGDCDNAADQVYDSLKSQKIIAVKTIGLFNESPNNCYTTPNDQYPIWMYHIANAIPCNDNKYYVLDFYLDKKKPIELSQWQKMITYQKKDCESFILYSNNCRVIGHPIFGAQNISYKWKIGCNCQP